MLVLGVSGALWRWEHPVLLSLFALPVTMAAYFAAKLLFMPDVEMGIIAAMRTFHALALLLCVVQLAQFCWSPAGLTGWLLAAADGALLLAALPVARMGVRKWFT